MRGRPGLNQRSKTNWENHELKTGFLRISIYWLNLKLARLIRKKKKEERKYKLPVSGMREETLLQTLKIMGMLQTALCQYVWKCLEFTIL